METKHDKHGGSAFLWGLIIGALFATLLTTKRGRQILQELTNLGLELFEDFAEERTKGNSSEDKIDSETEDVEEVKEDLESETAEVETREDAEEPVVVEKNGNGHSPKRLFKGIKRK